MNSESPLLAAYDPFAQDVMNNPHPFYDRQRREEPVLFLEKYDSYVFFKFQDCIDVLSEGNNAFVATDTTMPYPELLMIHNEGKIAEMAMDPLPPGAMLPSPLYEALRQAHTRPLRPHSVAAMATMLQRVADGLLDELLPRRRFDLTQEYGGIVSASAVCNLIGIPLKLAPEVLTLVNQGTITDPEVGGVDLGIAIQQCADFIAQYVAKRRGKDSDGSVPMVDGLLAFRYNGRPLTDSEIAMQIACEFIGGTETVPKVAAHGLMMLASLPDQLAAVRSDLDANVPIAVEEILRYCAPAQWFARTAQRDVTVADTHIKKGQRVLMVLASANRDEAEFDQPDKFIWNRTIKRMISFGFGQHHCTGVHLARLELRILIRTFLERVEQYSIDMDGALRAPSSFQWGWNKVPVIIEKTRDA